MGSIRLPGKMLMDLAGKPLMERILERLKALNEELPVIVATSNNPKDDILSEVVLDLGFKVFRGDEENLVSRYFECAQSYNADVICRFPGDNVFPVKSFITSAIECFLDGDYDFVSNICDFWGNGYPDGLGCEVISYDALSRLAHMDLSALNREHIAINFIDYSTGVSNPQFKVGTVQSFAGCSFDKFPFDVNTREDLDRMVGFYRLYDFLADYDPRLVTFISNILEIDNE